MGQAVQPCPGTVNPGSGTGSGETAATTATGPALLGPATLPTGLALLRPATLPIAGRKPGGRGAQGLRRLARPAGERVPVTEADRVRVQGGEPAEGLGGAGTVEVEHAQDRGV
ncbi:hypothetical protein GCM10017559_71190 [Streptosporangium longisporum]|uniref:Uncharacterized protein n=1 Tax=Streptosporangium longisporum TaxID=46187 RepID=A0ABP6L8N1_9ACTN